MSKITPNNNLNNFKKPKLFSSAFSRRVLNTEGEVREVVGNSLSDSNIQNTSSFRYDPPGVGLKSTQQINLDWSKFENHTFFNSAEAKVNVAFDRIINEFPFDGTREETESFFDDLTGFEKWVYDNFPKNLGQLLFLSASSTYIPVNDFAGSESPSFSKNKTGEKTIDPGLKSFTLESQIYQMPRENNTEVLFQYLTEDTQQAGFTVYQQDTASTESYDIHFVVTSGTLALSASTTLSKSDWEHVTFTFDRTPGVNRLKIFRDSVLVATSSKQAEIGSFGFTSEKFLIGSGSSHVYPSGTMTPNNTWDGVIDELRVYHKVLTEDTQLKFANKNVYQDDKLKLYFKFNEPSGTLGNLDNLVLDSSGNSLHSRIQGFTSLNRATGSYSFGNPLLQENRSLNPVLFSTKREVVLFNAVLLTSASLYDQKNPNMITRLVPQHYFAEGQQFEGLNSEVGTIGDQYTGGNVPGSGELGSPQLLSAFLFVWAKYFDEMKLYIDQLSNVLHVDYDVNDTVADQFLPMIFKYHGIEAPGFFNNSNFDQFIDGENIGNSFDISENSLKSVQNQIWRRILVNMGDIVKSKGTLHSIKSLIRSVGINPDTTLRIREFGGPKEGNLKTLRLDRTEVSTMIDMSGTLSTDTSTFDISGVPNNKPFLKSAYLSGSRIESGVPLANGTFVNKENSPIHGISDSPSDGLMTSGSWTFESLYKFENLLTGSHPVSQSLMRLNVTGTLGAINSNEIAIANLVAISGSTSDTSRIVFYTRPVSGTNAELISLPLTGVNIFDGSVWSVSVGKNRNDLIGSSVSSSFFIRAGKQNFGELEKTYTTSSFYFTDPDNLYSNALATVNDSGSFITIGSQSLSRSIDPGLYLNAQGLTNETLETRFSGKVSQIRFWSKGLTSDEWKEHVRNFKSIGVKTPKVNFNFNTQTSGAFQRLRLDATTDQPITESNASGVVTLTDFTQNNLTFVGTGFEPSKKVIKPETFRFSTLSTKFDEAATNNKVRVRGFLQQENIDQFDTATAPVYQITPSELPQDDTRFTIDFSIVDALNEDIVKIFESFDFFESAIGNPELRYSEDYPDLESMREIYFNRLTDKVNLKGFFEFFKWFDGSIGMFIEQLLPRKTNYLGTNFVIESHMLERPKVRYIEEEVHLSEDLRSSLLTTIVSNDGGSFSD